MKIIENISRKVFHDPSFLFIWAPNFFTNDPEILYVSLLLLIWLRSENLGKILVTDTVRYNRPAG